MAGENLLADVFEALPSAAFVVDDDVRVLLANEAGRALADASAEEIARWKKRGGDLLHCTHAHEKPEGCGHADACKECGVRGAVVAALASGEVSRRFHLFEPDPATGSGPLPLNVAASQLRIDGVKLAVLTLEVKEPAGGK